MVRRQLCEIADAMFAAYAQNFHDQRAAVVAMGKACHDSFTRIAAENLVKSLNFNQLVDRIIGGQL